ncbi:MAG: N-acetyltransferase [Planctomycetaceae bacterium]|nr:N-acetyltransferase [Planctomycetaceae bacterium]
MPYTLRPTRPSEFRETEVLTREAFTGLVLPAGPRIPEPGEPPCDEHLLLHRLRESDLYIPELDWVALDGDTIIGNIVYSHSKVVDDDGAVHSVITFGPLSVLPSRQRQGVGKALLKATMEHAKSMGFKGIVIYGHPSYYPRFGFVDAGRFGITTAEGENFDAFMACELFPGELDGVSGKFVVDEIFRISMDDLREFDKLFV